MALFMRIATRSRDSLVGGATLILPLRGSRVGGWEERSGTRGPVARKWFSGRCNHSAMGSRAPKELFLGMRLVPQERIYFHHRLRRQLTQHLENGQ